MATWGSHINIIICNHAAKLAYAFLQTQQLPPGVHLETMEMGATRFEVILPRNYCLRMVVSFILSTMGTAIGQVYLDFNHMSIYPGVGGDFTPRQFNNYEELLSEIKRVAYFN